MAPTSDWHDTRIHTLGHSTRPLDEFIGLLAAFGISVLADIRTIPRSRHNPQFNTDTLDVALRAHGVRYIHIPELGGLRKPRPDSPNAAWKNASFRGFADYMSTPEFEIGLAKLHSLVAGRNVAIMCAEAVPFRCHRSLVADALTARGAHVEHIATTKRSTPHRVTPFAEVRGIHVTYPPKDPTDT